MENRYKECYLFNNFINPGFYQPGFINFYCIFLSENSSIMLGIIKLRNKALLWTLTFGLLGSFTYAQNFDKIDNFTNQLKQAKTDSSKMFYLNELAWEYKNSIPDSSFYFAKEALRISKHDAYAHQSTTTYNVLGLYYRRLSYFDSAQFYFLKSYTIRNALGDQLGSANSILNLSSVYEYKNELDSSIFYGLQGLQFLDSLLPSHQKVQAKLLNTLGVYYLKSGQYRKAVQATLKGLRIRQKLALTKDIANSSLHLGYIYKEQDLLDKAIEAYQNALTLFRETSDKNGEAKALKNISEIEILNKNFSVAETLLLQAIHIFQDFNYQLELAPSYSNLGFLMERKGLLDSALYLQNQTFRIYTHTDNVQGLVITSNHLGYLWLSKQEYDSAYFYFKNAEARVRLENIPLRANIYGGLSQLYSGQSEYELAFEYQKKINDLNQQLFREKQQATTALFLEKSKRELAEKQNEVIEEQLKREKIYKKALYIFTSLLLLLLVATFIIIRYRKNQHRIKVELKDQEIEKIKLNEQLKQQEAESLDQIIEAQKEQRVKIAQDLHDKLGSLLVVMRLQFNYLKEIPPLSNQFDLLKKNNEQSLGEVDGLIDQVGTVVREISEDLKSGTLDKLGLIPAVEELCIRFQKTGKIKVQLHTESIIEKLPDDIEWVMFRNIQESLSNIISHAQANSVTVEIFRFENNIHLSVEDDGIGFNIDQLDNNNKEQGMGLSGMRYRCKKYGADFSVDSKVGRGTIIINSFTVKNPDNESNIPN